LDWAVAQVVVSSVLLPLGVGLVIGRNWPGARRWIPAIQKASALVLVICLVAILVIGWSFMGLVVRQEP